MKQSSRIFKKLRIHILTLAFILVSVSAVFADSVPSARFERLQGVIVNADKATRSIVIQLENANTTKVNVADNVWVHMVKSNDGIDRRSTKEDIFKADKGQLISVAGIIYSDRDELVAKDITVFGDKTGDYVFEDADWWSSMSKELSKFWIRSQFAGTKPMDAGLYRTKVTKSGQKRDDSVNLQETTTLSRLVYGLSSTYIMTADPEALEGAKALVDYQRKTMRCQSPDGNYVYWVHAIKDGKQIIPSLFNEDKDTIPLYEQIYCLAGLTQYYRITGDPQILSDIEKTIAFMDAYYWDKDSKDPLMQGYFSHVSPVTFSPSDVSALNRLKKNWNSVGDHLPAYLENLYLGTRNPKYLKRLTELGRLIAKHFPDKNSPFVFERFDRSWEPDLTYAWQQNRGVVGHNLKIGWCLTRLYHLTGEPSFLETAKHCADEMMRYGEDLRRGGWYDVIERKPDPKTGRYEFTWHDRKAWWQQEQGILAYYVLYGTTKNDKYLDTARYGAAFYNLAYLDHDDGGTFFEAQSDGTPYLLGDRSDKGNHSKSGYHDTELAYFSHLYTNLLVKHRSVTLHFKANPRAEEWIFHVQPVSFPAGAFELSAVTVNGKPYDSFNNKEMSIQLPKSEAPMEITATLAPVKATEKIR